MRYFLLGLPGSGKSYWGRLWAEKANVLFIDLDQYIEENEGRAIPAIFSVDGEAHFRHLESFYLQKAVEQESDVIIACGGGTPCFNKNMELMNANGVTIFINPPLNEIAQRLSRSKEISKRPLFRGHSSPQEIQHKLSELLETRLPFYTKATKTLTEISEQTLTLIQNEK